MTGGRKLAIATVGAALALSVGATAQAADPQFCEGYAHAAIVQVRGGLNNPPCVGGMQGDRWSADYRVHFNWCRGVSYRAAGAERDARTAYLRACTGQR